MTATAPMTPIPSTPQPEASAAPADPSAATPCVLPHPEHAVEPGFGPDTAAAAAMRSGVDGLGFFTSVVQRALVEA